MSRNLCEAVPSLSQQEVLDCYRQDIGLLNMGERTLKEVWQRLRAVFPQIPADDDLLLKVLREVPRNDAMFELARTLVGRYVLGIITDNCRERMDVLTAELKLDVLFNPIVISAVEHASKCDGTTRIFDAALDKAGCKAEEAIFIDNQEKNLTTPMKMGIKAYLHDHSRNDLTALRTALHRMEQN